MDSIKQLFSEMWDWISKPFKEDLPVPQLALVVVLFIIAAFILYDGLRILKSWMDTAADAVEAAA